MGCADLSCPICYGKEAANSGGLAQRLRIVSNEGEAATYVPYQMSLSDGTRLTGTTDEGGCTEDITEDIKNESSIHVQFLQLSPPAGLRELFCCQESVFKPFSISAGDIYSNQPGGWQTTEPVLDVKVKKSKQRRLSRGEIMMAQKVFGIGVDYGKVWVHHGGWWLFMGMQDSNTAVTPNGEMYYPDALYQNDYAATSIDGLWPALFMHEMTHVWQYQMGYPVKRKGLTVTSRGPSAYKYELSSQSRLCDFNMEQQAEIMSDYYMINVREASGYKEKRGKDPDLLRRVMTPFLMNPRDKVHLPKDGL